MQAEDSHNNLMQTPKVWHLPRFRDYSLLWTATISQVTASQIRFLAIPQWLLAETGSPAQVGLIGLVQLFVQGIAVVWGGTIADRFDRRYVMAAANFATFVALGLLWLADITDILKVWHVYAAIAFLSASWALASPARASLTPKVVPTKYLSVAVTADVAAQNAGWISGSLLFVLIALTADVNTSFALATVVAGISSLLPLFIKASGKVEEVATLSPLRSALQGFHFVRKHPILPGLFALDWGITVVSFYREILPVLATGLFAGGAFATGVLGWTSSSGALIGSILALLLAKARPKGWIVLGATFAYAILLIGLGASDWLWLGAFFVGALAAADSITVVARQTTVQLTTPDHLRGRAFAFMVLAAQTANNLGILWIGFFSERFGVEDTMYMGGTLAIIATLLIAIFNKPIREYRQEA